MRILMFSGPSCPYCYQQKVALSKWTTSHGVEFAILDITAPESQNLSIKACVVTLPTIAAEDQGRIIYAAGGLHSLEKLDSFWSIAKVLNGG